MHVHVQSKVILMPGYRHHTSIMASDSTRPRVGGCNHCYVHRFRTVGVGWHCRVYKVVFAVKISTLHEKTCGNARIQECKLQIPLQKALKSSYSPDIEALISGVCVPPDLQINCCRSEIPPPVETFVHDFPYIPQDNPFVFLHVFPLLNK